MAIWDDVISDQDKKVYEKAGFCNVPGLGKKPAILIIDMLYNFVGDKPEPILKSIERFPLSCGEPGWEAVQHISSLLPLARSKNVPLIYSTGAPSLSHAWTSTARKEDVKKISFGNDIVREIAPTEHDVVISKLTPSIFFGTPLISILNVLNADTLIFCGCVTSGCVRASVFDAASYRFRVAVIEECTFDRSEICHKVNLFDMNAKYARVVSLAEVRNYLTGLPGERSSS